MASILEELTGKYILLTTRTIAEKNGWFSASCDELGIATCAEAIDAAQIRLTENIKFLLDQATERGDIFDLFKVRSIRLYPLEASAVTIQPEPSTLKVHEHLWEQLTGTFSVTPTTSPHTAYAPIGKPLALAGGW